MFRIDSRIAFKRSRRKHIYREGRGIKEICGGTRRNRIRGKMELSFLVF
jgi:hypothetical protein